MSASTARSLKGPKMITRKEWGEFQSSGLLWFVNRTLHLFGWAIVFEYDNRPGNEDVLSAVYPARCKFRGFDDKTETAGFQNLTKYFGANSKELLKETLD